MIQIAIVVVRYKTPLAESQTMQGLAQVFRERPELLESVTTLVWDNSPVKLEDPARPFPFAYRFSDENLGVSGAYNKALEYAESLGVPWLLLLDQDTDVTVAYLEKMLAHSHEVEGDRKIAAVVPFVRSREMLISPQRFGKYVRNDQIPRDFRGVVEEPTGAINSGTLMRAAALRAIGGYSDLLWLDYSDTFVFTQLYRHGFVLFVAGDLEITHSLANLDYNNNMGEARYRNFLAAESTYSQLCRSGWSNFVFKLWLLARAGRQFRRFENKNFAKLTLIAFFRMFLVPTRLRMAAWKEELLHSRKLPAISKGKIVG